MGVKVDAGTTVGVIAEVPGVGIVLACGTDAPADNSVGYCPGCLFIHTDPTAGDEDGMLYLNQGTAAAANFDAIDITLI